MYGALGILMEVFWTGLCSLLKKDYRLISRTSIWMFFIYGIAVFLEPVSDALWFMPLYMRGVVYVVCIFSVEYLIGGALKRIHVCPWDYSGSKYNIKGIIRLDYAPVWFIAGLIFEGIHRYVK